MNMEMRPNIPYQNYIPHNVFFAPQPYQSQNPIEVQSSKWITKSPNQDINDQVKEILVSNKKDSVVINFLRSYDNMKKIGKMSLEVKSKLLKEIFYQITKYVHEEDLLILDYCIKWIKYFLDSEYPQDLEMMKQLYSILFLVYNSVNEETLADSCDLLLNHPHLLKVYAKSNVENPQEQSHGRDASNASKENESMESLEKLGPDFV